MFRVSGLGFGGAFGNERRMQGRVLMMQELLLQSTQIKNSSPLDPELRPPSPEL